MKHSIAKHRPALNQRVKPRGRARVVLLALIAALGVSAVSGSIVYQWQRSTLEPEGDSDWAAEREAKAALKGRGFLVTANPLTKHTETVSFLGTKQLEEADLQKLAALRHLIYVDFQGCNVSDAQLRYLDGLPRLVSLNLIDTGISDEGLAHLTDLPDLIALYLQGTRISNQGLPHLAHLRNLKILDVRNTCVTQQGLTHLGDMQNLRWVLLDEITDAGAEELMRMTHLTRLSVNENKISPRMFKQLRTALPRLVIEELQAM